jgi:excisionase family DNA binding protein
VCDDARQEVNFQMPEKLLVDKKEAAEMLSISVRLVEQLIRRRELEVRRIGRRALITVKSIAAFVARDGASPSNTSHLN